MDHFPICVGLFSDMTPCTFNDCSYEALPGSTKCSFHKNRRQCKAADCRNQVYARGLCVRHGGKKTCEFNGCTLFARGGNFCAMHGGSTVKRFCRIEGCQKQAHAKNLCVRHGGGRLCYFEGCQHHAREGGWCHKHRHCQRSRDSSFTSPIKSETVASPVKPVEILPIPVPEVSKMSSPSELYHQWLQLTREMLFGLHGDPSSMGALSTLLAPLHRLPLPETKSDRFSHKVDWDSLLLDDDVLMSDELAADFNGLFPVQS
ncbi:hypothetical protein AeMF1_012825 [Aphanomyces euteiches]|nr:hypothetical protein AeMF1_012825 [Aphanomyces euteiches]KAH9181205.1 hypothetical protein AeNC1_016818 [Aphanomyces euteiches]